MVYYFIVVYLIAPLFGGRYLHTVERNATASIERERFFRSDEFQVVTERASRYFPGAMRLSIEQDRV